MESLKCVFRVASRVQEEQVNIRVGEEPASAKTAGGDQREVLGTFRVCGDRLVPEAQQNGVDKRGSPGEGDAALAADGKLLLDTRGFPYVQVP